MHNFLKPDHVCPTDKEVELAESAIPALLKEFGNRSRRQYAIRAPVLIQKLCELGHSLPASEWAIHKLLFQQRLQVDNPSSYKPSWDRVLFDRVKSYFRDEMTRVGFVWRSTSKPLEWDRSLLRSTRDLWAIAPRKRKPKGHTDKGSSEAKDSDTFDRWKSFLLSHHSYDGDLNQTPATPTAIEKAGICSKAQASRHFKRQWGSFKAYKRICGNDPKGLEIELKLLAGEMPMTGIATLITDLQDATAKNPAESIDDD